MVSSMFGKKAYKRPAAMMPLPVMHEIIEGLWLGGLQAAEDVALLKCAGITHMVSLGVFPLAINSTVKQMKVHNLMDIPSADISPHLPGVVDFIRNALESGGRVLVHCYAGVSRSTSCIVAYLMTHELMSYQKALNLCKKIRPIANPNMGFQL